MTARAIAVDVQSQTISATCIAKDALDRAEARNPSLNALTCLNPDLLADAAAVDARIAARELLPLAGVPVVIKDNIWVRGMKITNGSRLFADFIAPEDATAVTQLRDAGAVILGIGACSEFACKGVTNTPLHGITRHPDDPDLTPGGSSGGPAVAVAADIVPIAIGTDAGGSSRRPPAHVGIVGFKPGQDVIAYGPGFSEPVWGISALCPIAANIYDVALVFSVLSGLQPVPPPANARFAYAPDMGLGAAIDHDVAQACNAAVKVLSQDAQISHDAPVWDAKNHPSATMPLQFAGLAALYGAAWQAAPLTFDPDIGAQIKTGLELKGTDVAHALQASQSIRTTMRIFLGRYDFLITPTTPCAAWPSSQLGPREIGGEPASPRDHAAFTPQANHAGLPAISIPCGFTQHNLPVGLQIIGHAGADMALLAVAQKFEAALQKAGLTKIHTKATS